MKILSTEPIVTIKTARRLLGKDADMLDDAEIIALIDRLEQLASAFISNKVQNGPIL